ncbi:SWIB/MDM2 domain protein [Necator americanus]|uniref:SWIB/MDM2 domain protein n=1 Tax=Necator americanus TaxID=51031 RepID=W2SI07_NECAM|nr:SWIB/MDM2 domain protein [Necator americanus]ETN68372.1 SWIB/MDM2 domain protein [Necator americanus]
MQQQRAIGTPGQPLGRYGPQPGTTPQSAMRRPGAAQMPSQGAPMQPSRVSQPLRKKKRYADKLISPQVRELVPESQAYMDLLAFEQKLDATITRKKLDIQEGEEGSVPMWELRVEGRLIEDQNGANAGQTPAPARPLPKRKFSSFFKSLVIELDKDIYGPDNHLVEWHRTPTTNETDGFQVKRPGDRPVKCTILLLLDYQPMKFKLHPRLAKVLGIAAETRPKIIEALWQYIKTHKLQDPVDHDTVNNDTFLEQVFSCKRMRFMEIPQRLHQLLQQPDPLVLSHVIKHNEGGAEKNTACYDIDVEVEDPLKQHMAAFVHAQANTQDIANLDQKIYDVVDQINEWKTRRDFYVRFADHPYDFIRKWLVSQSQDLKTMTEASGEGEAERRSDHYYRPETQEGVFRYIYQKVQQKRAELEQGLGVRNN